MCLLLKGLASWLFIGYKTCLVVQHGMSVLSWQDSVIKWIHITHWSLYRTTFYLCVCVLFFSRFISQPKFRFFFSHHHTQDFTISLDHMTLHYLTSSHWAVCPPSVSSNSKIPHLLDISSGLLSVLFQIPFELERYTNNMYPNTVSVGWNWDWVG